MLEPDISLVVPIFNERDNLPTLIREIGEALRPSGSTYEIVLVDDASTDGSLEIMGRLAARTPEIRTLSFARNVGQSIALVAGFRACRAPVVVTLDGDLQNDPADIPSLLSALEGYDLVSGIRSRRQDSRLRKLSSRIANRMRRAFVGDGITDIGCALKAYRREWLVDVPSFNGVHRFLAGLLQVRGARVVEVPVSHRPRRHGVSKYGLHNRLWRGLADLLGVLWLLSRWPPTPPMRELSRLDDAAAFLPAESAAPRPRAIEPERSLGRGAGIHGQAPVQTGAG